MMAPAACALSGDCLHVVHPAGAVIDMGQHDRGHLLGDVVSHRFRIDDLEFMTLLEAFEQPIGHVEVGRKIAVVGQHDLAPGRISSADATAW
jgi:hypothetical protein